MNITVLTKIKSWSTKAMLVPKDSTFCLEEKIQVCFLSLCANGMETSLVYFLDEKFKLPVPY